MSGPLPKKEKQLPKGIMRSAVPLPCFFDVVKSQKVAGEKGKTRSKRIKKKRKKREKEVQTERKPAAKSHHEVSGSLAQLL